VVRFCLGQQSARAVGVVDQRSHHPADNRARRRGKSPPRCRRGGGSSNSTVSPCGACSSSRLEGVGGCCRSLLAQADRIRLVATTSAPAPRHGAERPALERKAAKDPRVRNSSAVFRIPTLTAEKARALGNATRSSGSILVEVDEFKTDRRNLNDRRKIDASSALSRATTSAGRSAKARPPRADQRQPRGRSGTKSRAYATDRDNNQILQQSENLQWKTL
jgi:hypothetical protein